MRGDFYIRIALVLVSISIMGIVFGFVLSYRSAMYENIALSASTSSATNTDESEYAANEEELIPARTIPALSESLIETTHMNVFGSIPYWDQKRAVAVFKENVHVFDIISVFWYHLEKDGSIVKYKYANEDSSLITFAHDNDVKVLALIANLPEDTTWDHKRVEAAIGSPERRQAHIAAILDLVENRDFDGVNIDYEFLHDNQTNMFNAFIRELASALHARGKILAVAIHAQTPGSATRGQDMAALQAADILSFMTYDEYWDTSDPGPPASIPWVRSVLAHAVSLGVDPKKIFMGIPLYAYDWPRRGNGWGKARGIEYDEVVRIVNEHNADVVYDEEAETPYFTYTADGIHHEVWFENVFSVERRLELAKEFGVGGVMFWRQGREDKRIYDALNAL